MHKVNREFLALKEDFKKYYDKELRGKFEELEPIRQKYLKSFFRRILFFVIVVASYIYVCMNGFVSEETYSSEGLINFYIFYFLIESAICYDPVDNFASETKFAVMDKILRFFGNFKYSQRCDFIGKKDIEDSDLFGSVDEQVKDDGFSGEYRGSKIRISEQKVIEGTGKDAHTIFRGVLIALRLNKEAQSNVVVYGKSLRDFLRYKWYALLVFGCSFAFLARVGWDVYKDNMPLIVWLMCYAIPFGIILVFISYCEFKNCYRMEQRVCLEDVVFSKRWKVYADNQIEARYVLTPALMERMLEVKKLFHGNRLDFSFWDNNLLIAVHTGKNMFETTSLFKSALDYNRVWRVIRQMYSIFSVIDVLKSRNRKTSES